MLWGLVGLLAEPCCVSCEAPVSARGRIGLCPGCLGTIGDVPQVFELGDPVASAWALGAYDQPLGTALREAKFGQGLHAIRCLGGMLGQAAVGRLPRVDAVVPVPIPWPRMLTRGFDQGLELGREVAASLQVPVVQALRRRPSAPMSRGADMKDRILRARSSFRGRGSVPPRVLLVDDVVTTGATTRACANALIGQGARRVHVLTLARRRSRDEITMSRRSDVVPDV